MNKILLSVGLGVILAIGALVGLFAGREKSGPRVGVVVPIEHQAMRAMVGGFQEELHARLGEGVQVDVMNAQGDFNVQRAIIEKFRGGYDLVVPIGTDVTRQTVHAMQDQAVLGLDVTHEVDSGNPNVMGVLEAAVDPSVDFIHRVLSNVQKVTVIYHPSEKITRQVRRFQELAEAQQLAVQTLVVQSLPDLYAISKGVDRDSDLLFILKDHLVASGVGAVAQAAQERRIPLLTSDEGSVQDGGGIALGNREADIGRQGARMAMRLLQGEASSEVSFAPTPELTVFVNPKALAAQGVDTDALIQQATSCGYAVQEVGR